MCVCMCVYATQVLREMPRPLLTWELYEDFIQLCQIKVVSKQYKFLRETVSRSCLEGQLEGRGVLVITRTDRHR